MAKLVKRLGMQTREGSRFGRTALVAMMALVLAVLPSCTTNGMASNVHQLRIGMGGNDIGSEAMHQYYLFFGLIRLNEVDVQRVVSDYTSYDVITGSTYGDWFWSTLLLPLTISRQTVKVDW